MEPVSGFDVTSISAINGPDNLDGATVDRNVNIQVTFNEAIDATTVNGDTFKILKGSIVTGTNAPTLSADGKTVTIRTFVGTPLTAATNYKLVVSAAVKNTDGDTLETAVEANFTTNSLNAVRLTTAGTNNDTGVSTDIAENAVLAGGINRVVLTFINGVNSGTVSPTTVKLTNVTTGTVYSDLTGATVTSAAGVVTINLAGVAAPNNAIPVGQEIKVEVTDGVLDYNAASVAPFTRTFFTQAAFAANASTIANGDALAGNTTTVNPSLTSWTHPNTTVFPGFRILTTFTRAINTATLTDDTMYLKNVATGAQVPGTVTYNATNRTATFVPDADLTQLTGYEFVVSKGGTVTDVNGTVLAEQGPQAFTTIDVTAPTVVSTTPIAGSASFAFDGNIVITFNERMNTAAISASLSNGVGTIANPFGAAYTIALKNETTSTATVFNGVNLLTGYTPSWNSAGTVLTLRHIAGQPNLAANTTYSLLLKGYDSVAGAAYLRDNSNVPFSETNTITFATGAGDVARPSVTSIKSGTYASGATLTAGQKNVNPDRDIQIVFSELLDAAGNIQEGANIALESYSSATGLWTAVGGFAGNATLTTDAVNNLTYITIPNADIPADSKLRVRIVPDDGAAHVVRDITQNLMQVGYSFEFTTNGTLGLAASTTAAKVTVTADAAAGTTALTTTLAPAVGNIVAVEMANGQFFFDTVAASAAGTTTLTNPLPTLVSSGASIVNMTGRNGSFTQMETGYNLNDPLAIVISGVATDLPNADTINSTTVTLTKAGEAVATTVEPTIIGTNAYVTINPTESLAANTQYTVSVLGVQDAWGNEITTAQTRTFVSGAATVQQLDITSVTPADVATGVAVNAPIVINFNETPDQLPALLTNGASDAAAKTISLKNPAGTFVAGTIAWSNSNKTATITPTAFLANNAIYELQIGGGFVSSAAVPTSLTARSVKVTYNFTTEEPASVDPAITSSMYYDQNGDGVVNEGDLVIVQLNTAIAESSLTLTDAKADFALNAAGRLDDGTAGHLATQTLSTDKLTVTIVLGQNPVLIPNSMKINAKSGAVQTLNGVNVTTTAVTVTK